MDGPNFEAFRKEQVALKREPQVTIQKRGVISLNNSAYTALGAPEAVELLYDVQSRIVGLHPVDARASRACFLRSPTGNGSGPFVISAMAYLHYYDIDLGSTRRWTAFLDGGILCVDLRQPGTEVTSNRARPRTL
jgi:hypothetical protein